MSAGQWARFILLLIGCGLLGGWMWTRLAPQPPADGGQLSALGTIVGLAVAGALNAILLRFWDAR